MSLLRSIFAPALVLVLVACDRQAPPTPPAGSPEPDVELAVQIQHVREGRSTMIRLLHTPVDNDDVRLLADLAGLETLVLGDARISDEALAVIGELPDLRYLILTGASITDAGLENLHGLRQLESLYLTDTQVTDAGVAELAKALPELHIHW